jgi:hypothetical protein
MYYIAKGSESWTIIFSLGYFFPYPQYEHNSMLNIVSHIISKIVYDKLNSKLSMRYTWGKI